MDIEQLSKSQIVLLTLLVSFVTSIATGIVTVSLVDQAPPAIAQTVNRVIERTVQAAAPAQTAASAVTQGKTVIVNESDLVAQAIADASPSVVRVYNGAGSATSSAFLSLGIVVSSTGDVATDASALGDSTGVAIALPDGTTVPASVGSTDPAGGIAYLTPATSTAAQTIKWAPAKINPDAPILGENVVTLSGETVARIGNGLVSSVLKGDGATATVIDTNVPDTAIMNGSPLISTNGEVIGVSTGVSRASSPTGFISASLVGKPIQKPAAPAKAK